MSCSHPAYCYLAAALLLTPLISVVPVAAEENSQQLTLSWANNFLTIHGSHLPGGELKVQYLEAYCRPGSTDRDWGKTVIKHRTELVARDRDGKSLKLRCTLADGIGVTHDITAGEDAITFQLVATNPTSKSSDATS